MRKVSHAFTDTVSGKDVNCYHDRLGRWWLAEGRWSLFRVPTDD